MNFDIIHYLQNRYNVNSNDVQCFRLLFQNIKMNPNVYLHNKLSTGVRAGVTFTTKNEKKPVSETNGTVTVHLTEVGFESYLISEVNFDFNKNFYSVHGMSIDENGFKCTIDRYDEDACHKVASAIDYYYPNCYLFSSYFDRLGYKPDYTFEGKIDLNAKESIIDKLDNLGKEPVRSKSK